MYRFDLNRRAGRQSRSSTASMIGGLFAMLIPLLASAAPDIDYQRQIQPLFDRYCVACHACLDAPCQLNLTHGEGVRRGASKARVYDGTRLSTAATTRLFVDGHSEQDWRRQGFFSVTESQDGEPALLERMLTLKAAHPLRADQPLPEGVDIGIRRTQFCPAPEEGRDFVARSPNLGMPFGLPGMQQEELQRVRDWLAQGAPVNEPPIHLAPLEKRQLRRWESWLNRSGMRRQLLARWLFEHWAFARLYFDQVDQPHFFRLVRSSTPPGEPVAEIASRQPNSDPGQRFYYRFKVQKGTRVYKTHITFPLNDRRLRRIEALFLGEDWSPQTLPGYTAKERSNPFMTFAAIPAKARYQFMLEHAEYFIRTFIRGPVCRGQLATDVIRDHFWVMFQHPQQDPYIVDAAFRRATTPLLDLPGLEDDLLDGARSWLKSLGDHNRYSALRQKALARLQRRGPTLDSLWTGNSNGLLTVFRHHDSATVRRGWSGQLPLTLWLMDYPLLERSYYNLVVNFDVYGNLAHQAQTRLYFDLIRNDAEVNFLRLLPADARQEVLNGWYQGSGKIKLWTSYQSVDTVTPTAVDYHGRGSNPKQELLAQMLVRFADVNVTPDPINRPAGEASSLERLLSRLSGVPARAMPSIGFMPNASILRIGHPDGTRQIFTLVRNRRHSNVAFVLGESLRYQQEKDQLSVLPGVATSYPNFIFDVPLDHLGAFVDTLRDPALAERELFIDRLIRRWGVLRSAPDFWEQFHDINRYLQETMPLQAGILDINRYTDYRKRPGWPRLPLPELPGVE